MGLVAYLAVLSAPSAGCQPDRVVLGQLPPPPGEPPPPPCDGSPAVLAHIPGILLRPMAIDEENFYVVAAPGRCDGGSCDGGAATPQTIWRVPQTGAPPTRLVQGQDRIGDIVPFGSAIYWTTVDTSAGDVATGVVWKIGLGAGDAPERVVKDRPASGALAVASPWILWAEQGVDLSGGPSGRIMRVGIDGGPPALQQQLEPGEIPRALLVQPSQANPRLLWTTADPRLDDQARAEVAACPIDPPLAPTTSFATATTGGAGAIATTPSDDEFVYSSEAGVMKVSFEAGRKELLFPTSGLLDDIKDDGYGVYFVDPATHQLSIASEDFVDGGFATRPIGVQVDPASALRVFYDYDFACLYWIDAPSATVQTIRAR
jgi:hypothetical protein